MLDSAESCSLIFALNNGTQHGKKITTDVLLQEQKFPRMCETYKAQAKQAFQVLVMPSLLNPIVSNPRQGVTEDDMLNSCHETYTGYLIHVAAALGRDEAVKEILEQVIELGWIPALKNLLRVRDNMGHTVLQVALLAKCHRTLSVILDCIELRLDRFSSGSLYQDAVRDCTFLLHRKPVKELVQLVISKASDFILPYHHSAYSFIYDSQFVPLRSCLSTYRTLAVQGGPHSSHVAAWAYSAEDLNPSRRVILEYLTNCIDLPFAARREEINDVCRLILDDHARRSGTAAHFALFHLASDAVNVTEVQPDFPTQSAVTRSSVTANNTGCREGNVESTKEILDMLHRHGVDFRQVNFESKTALDLLPPDADPRIVDRLVNFMRSRQPDEAQVENIDYENQTRKRRREGDSTTDEDQNRKRDREGDSED
ncbi:hypothetical protein ACOMHN_062368 [Nucella lapillus]